MHKEKEQMTLYRNKTRTTHLHCERLLPGNAHPFGLWHAAPRCGLDRADRDLGGYLMVHCGFFAIRYFWSRAK
jgi:hypothetical protein